MLTLLSFQQTSIKEDTSNILSSTDSLHHDLNRLATNLDIKLAALEIILQGRNNHDGTNSTSLKHLRNTVKTAGTVVTSASTAMMDDMRERDEEAWDNASERSWTQNDDATHSDLTVDWVASQSAEQVSRTSLVSRENITDMRLRLQKLSSPVSPISTGSVTPEAWRNTQPTVGAADEPPSIRLEESTKVTEIVNTDDAKSRETQPITGTTNEPSLTNELPSIRLEEDFKITEITTSDDTALLKPARSKRRNFSISQLFSARPKEDGKAQPKNGDSKNPMCMDGLHISDGRAFIKFTFVGDGACGKTCFLM
jgi:hypothetical protein